MQGAWPMGTQLFRSNSRLSWWRQCGLKDEVAFMPAAQRGHQPGRLPLYIAVVLAVLGPMTIQNKSRAMGSEWFQASYSMVTLQVFLFGGHFLSLSR